MSSTYLQIYGQATIQDPRDDMWPAKAVGQAQVPPDSKFIILNYSIPKSALTDKGLSIQSNYSLLDLDDVLVAGGEQELDGQMARRLHAEWNGTDPVPPYNR